MINQLIEDYIINLYLFSSNADGWCVYDKVTGRHIVLQKLIRDIERIFPNLGSTNIVTEWWATNINITNGKVQWFMSDYKLVLGTKTLKAWDVVDRGGKELEFNNLLNFMPSHHHNDQIQRLFDEWFDDKLLEANELLMKG